MEKTTVTIEIKQEVSIALLWIAAGVVVVSLAFLLAPRSTELWPALDAAGVAVAVYLIALLAYVLRKPLSTWLRILVGGIALVVLGCTAFTWLSMEDQTLRQGEQVMRFRKLAGRVRMYYEVPQPLLKTLEAYYQKGGAKNESLADMFRKLHPGVAVGSSIHKPMWEGDPLRVMVEALDPDRIVLVSEETYVVGRDPNFRNYDGKTGIVQEKFILTEKGITHVSEN
jgi:hypothetical protein